VGNSRRRPATGRGALPSPADSRHGAYSLTLGETETRATESGEKREEACGSGAARRAIAGGEQLLQPPSGAGQRQWWGE
jgi:hypothetical protein